MSTPTSLHATRQAQLLRDFAENLAKAGIDEDELVKRAVMSCKDLLQAKICSVWLTDESSNCLLLRAADGYVYLKGDDIRNKRYPIGDPKTQGYGLTSWIYDHQEPVSADTHTELRQKPGWAGALDRDFHGIAPETPDEGHICQQFYGGPITLGNDRLGVLKVENKTVPDEEHVLRFSEAEKAALDTVAAMLALALNHARASKAATDQLHTYNSFTLHSFKNELIHFHAVLRHLVNLKQQLGRQGLQSASEALDRPIHVARLGIHALEFYLKHLLKFLRAKIEPQKLPKINILKILQDEIWLLAEAASEDLNVAPFKPTHDIFVRGDSEFLVAAFKEVLRNARTAITSRRNKEEEQNAGLTPPRGIVEVKYEILPSEAQSPAELVEIVVTDDGLATVSDEARRALELGWAAVLDPKKAAQIDKRGLAFLHWVISEHGGSVSLDRDTNNTTIRICIPIAEQYTTLTYGKDPHN